MKNIFLTIIVIVCGLGVGLSTNIATTGGYVTIAAYIINSFCIYLLFKPSTEKPKVVHQIKRAKENTRTSK